MKIVVATNKNVNNYVLWEDEGVHIFANEYHMGKRKRIVNVYDK